MIQSVIQTMTATLAAPGDALLQVGNEMVEGPDFGALLALSATSAASGELPMQARTAVSAPTPAALPALPVAAPTGNILPLAWPVNAAAAAAPASLLTSPADAAIPDQPGSPAAAKIKPGLAPGGGDLAPPVRPAETTKRSTPVQHAQQRKTEEVSVAAEQNAVPTDQQTPPAEAVAVPELATLAATTLPAAIVPAPVQMPVDPLEPAPADPAIPRANSAKPLPEPKLTVAQPQPAAQAIAHASPQAAFLRTLATPVPQPEQPAETQPPAPRAPALLRVEIALPEQAVLTAKPAGKIAVPLRSYANSAAELPVSAIPAATGAPLPQTTLAAPAFTASPRQLDFAALVDRLVAAREAVQPPGALLTVAHAEFGPVELRFRHDERGLAVSLASADPDFARVAAAAPPPQLPSSIAQSGAAEPGQAGGRGDSQAATNGSASSNPRGQQSDRRGDTAPQSNRHQRSAADDAAAPRSGIFA